MDVLWSSSVFNGGNTAYIEDLFEQYLADPATVSEAWRTFFQQLPATQKGNGQDVSHAAVREQFAQLVRKPFAMASAVSSSSVDSEHELKQIKVMRLINAYRLHGHLHAKLDPLDMVQNAESQLAGLSLEDHGLTTTDLSIVFDVDTFVGAKKMTLGELFQALQETYCGSIGIEYMHIPFDEEREWIQARIEGSRAKPVIDAQTKRRILENLTAAEGLEKYLGLKYPGAKRFSLEGGDAFIPMLDECIQRAGAQGIKEIVIGMAHRGRLNVLVNTFGKKPSDLFSEFEGKKKITLKSGDVKYHQGFSSDVTTPGGNVHIALAFNPSHLEIVTPVVIGSVRARGTRWNNISGDVVLPIAIHGDSAFTGQGVVMETLNMSQTRGYGIGGTVNIIINNQVGFTTSNRYDTRSTLYCSDIAKAISVPIFHVNADDAEAVLLVMQIALDFRMKFKKDVVIDLVCYRRHGHNEADEPSATQPLMYQKISKHPTARQIYANALVQQKAIGVDLPNDLVKQNRDLLDQGECVAKNITLEQNGKTVDWEPYFCEDWRKVVKTALTPEGLKKLAPKITDYPKQYQLHSRVSKIIEDRKKMYAGELALDWGCAELLAYASLLDEGYSVRISGQDCRRGTFFHRHAAVLDQITGESYISLQHLNEKQPKVEIIDSVLSEEAVMAFEYGYATTDPTTLVIWEAQFGDFVNGAQVVIDQFISSGKEKWGRLCGLTLLLPHGYEGQGPEHSSARLERFLQLCAQHNIQVCVPSTAAQVFHMLRRQMIRPMRLPLIVMSPKSLLRHKLAACDIQQFLTGEFQVVLKEIETLDNPAVKRVVMCSGKVYYDLLEARTAKKRQDIAIIRIEQLYPFPEVELNEVLVSYPNATDIVWCQEEPQNQGAWYTSQHHMRACLKPSQTLRFAGRPAAASPAVGYYDMHLEEQSALVEEALR